MRPSPFLLAAAGLLASAALLADGALQPKAAPEQYPSHAQATGGALGADFLGRYLPGDKGSFMTGNYLVVETAFYPRMPKPVQLSSGDFRLRLNGKLDLVAQSPGIVAGAIRNPRWEGDRGVTVGGGVGPAVIVSRPTRREPRFPGDPEIRTPGGGSSTRIEDGNVERDGGDAAIRRALPETECDKPVAGLLYFAWKDPLRKLKSIELVYDGPAGKMILPLK